jgi:DNA-directed RNA polymerase subunit RPC12/RpoP
MTLFGRCELEVTVQEDYSWKAVPKKCQHLGHGIFKCGHCKKGYPRAKSTTDHDARCPECQQWLVVKLV